MSKLFISLSSTDDGFMRELQQALGDHGQEVLIDSRQLRGGDSLLPQTQKAIEEASAYAVVVSPASLQSKWIGQELRHALAVQKQRGKGNFPVIPLSLDGTKLGVLETLFGEEPLYIPVSSAASGVDAAIHPILVALGKREPVDVAAAPPPPAQSLEELVLELTDLTFLEQDGARLASARARLIYEPATPEQRKVESAQPWRFIAPLGPIEAEELRWYLEKFATWPSEIFRERAKKVEDQLVTWGRLLHDAAFQHSGDVRKAWANIADHSGRRFSVKVDAALDIGAPAADVQTAREAATALLGLPWELLHDGAGFLFQGARPTRVRRRLPNTRDLLVPVMSTPIRILLVTARPEDDDCEYIDHRASALPLVEAMEELGGLVRIHVLSPPTVPALHEELYLARRDGAAYHVVHFDGHGTYDRHAGLGGLCFEEPQDIGRLEHRRHATVYTNDLGPLLRDHRIPLVFLEACQTATAEKASESVASELLKAGVASVVAMSHSVLVETAGRFVEAFYDALARGARVGDAMLEGQRRLKDEPLRAGIGVGELRLQDWFVPVLFQDKDDPQLFRATPAKQTQDDFRKALDVRLGELPATPETGFIGRSRDLLVLQRLLRHERYAVVRGQGGEGKTALAAEFGRWMVRSHQVRRAAFVSVATHSNCLAVLDAIGRQLVGQNYSAATFDDLEKASLPVEQALREQSTLIVMDNMESILRPPYVETSEALSEEARHELDDIFALCVRLLKAGETRLVFTSREALPAPFDAERNRRELHWLDSDDAVRLVERALHAEADGAGAAAEATRESIEELVDAVHGHARTLALIAPALRRLGVDGTRKSLVRLMRQMDKRFPADDPKNREKSLFASVELSLRRMSAASRKKARVLGMFFGAVDLEVLREMTQWKEADVLSLARELIDTGLATPDPFKHLTLDPALCPYLLGRMNVKERDALTARWVKAMRPYAGFLNHQQSRQAEVAATLTVLELPNLFALLDLVQRAGDAEATISLANSLYSLLKELGKPRLLKRVGQVRDAAAAGLGDAWNHTRFEAERTRIEQQLDGGSMREALNGAQQLLQRARAAGETAYPVAEYDLALACWLLARVLTTAGSSEQALSVLAEARQRFEGVAKERANKAAAGMAFICLAEKGDCLLALGHLDEAAAAYEEVIRHFEPLGNTGRVATAKAQLGTVRKNQRLYPEALAAYAEAREWFTQLNQPDSVALGWHETGIVYEEMGQPEAAEDAYLNALALGVKFDDDAGQAATLLQLGNLYSASLNRPEEAVTFYRRAANKYVNRDDRAKEGGVRNNLAEALRSLRRLDEARQEIRKAIECDARFDHASGAWSILANIETDAGNLAAAVEAKNKAIACYLSYRRDGGENHDTPGRMTLAVTESLLAGDPSEAASLLQQQLPRFEAAKCGGDIRALQAIVAGRRDRTLADAPDLHPKMAAEILFLLETLEKAGK